MRGALVHLVLVAGACAAVASTLRAEELSQDPARPLFDEAKAIIENLRQKKTFFESYRAESLLAQFATLEYQVRPRDGLYHARSLKEPFYSSLALGAISAYSIETEPEAAMQLLLGAQERALSIDHWMGTDSTSLNYLFQLTPLFEKKNARRLLTASQRNLDQWLADGSQKSKPMLELAKQVIAIDPDWAEPLLRDATSDRWFSPHMSESIQLLTRYLAHEKPEWAATQVAGFYASGKPLPMTNEPLFALVMDDAVRDPFAALEKIEKIPEERRDEARLDIVCALHDAGKSKRAEDVITTLEARPDWKPDRNNWAKMLLDQRARWEAEAKRASEAEAAMIGPEKMDAFLAKPDLDELRLHISGAPLKFRDRQQAEKFLEAATPLAEKISDFPGYPHHGSPRSVMLGTLAELAAAFRKAGLAKEIADKIEYPELRAFYLMNAYETIHPLHPAVRRWPTSFYQRVEIVVGQ